MDSGKRTFYLGRYNCIEQLGTGPLGETYRAKVYGVAGFEKQFAVKRLHPQLSSDEAFVSRFVQAASAFAALEHPRIARVHEVNAQGAHYYIVTDLVRGIDLRRLLDMLQLRGEALAPDAAMWIATAVAEALESAHARTAAAPNGVLHLGLTAPSIMVTLEGDVTLIDVGLVSSLMRPGWSEDDALAPTLAYVAPELWEGEQPDARADVFSLGVVLHELLGGTRVFVSDRALELRRAMEAGPPPPPPADPRLQQVLSRALEPDRNRRFARTAEMQAALQSILGGRGERARADLAALARRLAMPRERRTGAFAAVTLTSADAGGMSPMAAKPSAAPATPRAWSPPTPKPPVGGVLSKLPTFNTLAGIGPDDQALVPIELVEVPGTPTEKAMPTVQPADADAAAQVDHHQPSTVVEQDGAGSAAPPSASGPSRLPQDRVASAATNGEANGEMKAVAASAQERSWSPPPLTPSPPSPVPSFAPPKVEEPLPPVEPARSGVPGMKLPPRGGTSRAVLGSVVLLAIAGVLAVYAGLGGSSRTIGEPTSQRRQPAAVAGAAMDVGTRSEDLGAVAEAAPEPQHAAAANVQTPVAAHSTATTFEIVTLPAGAALFIDGEPQGTAPARVELAPGVHKLIAMAEGDKILKRDIEVKPGDKVELTLEAARLPSEISGSAGLKVRCRSRGELRVFVDGVDSGRSCPNEERIAVTPGPHKIGLYSPRTDEMHEVEHDVAEAEHSTRVYVKY